MKEIRNEEMLTLSQLQRRHPFGRMEVGVGVGQNIILRFPRSSQLRWCNMGKTIGR